MWVGEVANMDVVSTFMDILCNKKRKQQFRKTETVSHKKNTPEITGPRCQIKSRLPGQVLTDTRRIRSTSSEPNMERNPRPL
jgi:hypothetical protein